MVDGTIFVKLPENLKGGMSPAEVVITTAMVMTYYQQMTVSNMIAQSAQGKTAFLSDERQDEVRRDTQKWFAQFFPGISVEFVPK